MHSVPDGPETREQSKLQMGAFAHTSRQNRGSCARYVWVSIKIGGTQNRSSRPSNFPFTESVGVLLDADERRPRTRGSIDKANDHHVVERHLPLPETPPFISPCVEREQLPETVNETVRKKRPQTHITVSFEVFNVPLDASGNFLDQLAPGY